MKLEKLLWTLLVLVVMLGFEGCEKEKESGDPLSRAGLLPEDTEEYNEEIDYILSNLKCAPKPVAGMKDDILGKWQVVRGWYSPCCRLKNRTVPATELSMSSCRITG
ncbi:MAG: hypothetical protein LUG96_04400 [Tannerellaceae bacterium]|nr:hypothetical protein [Tannerellaceae bacterium]